VKKEDLLNFIQKNPEISKQIDFQKHTIRLILPIPDSFPNHDQDESEDQESSNKKVKTKKTEPPGLNEHSI
jgi:hypothetical protein